MWIKIEGYENYVVNEDGVVVNTNTGKELKHIITEKGYHRVDLCRNGKARGFRVHRLVLMAFNPIEDSDKWQVNHKDENKDNNNITNLEWCDAKYNNNYGTRNQRIRKPVNQYDRELNFIRSFESITKASEETGINYGDISRAARGVQLKYAGGFKWRYTADTIDGIEPIDKTY